MIHECKVGEGVSVYLICKDALRIYREMKSTVYRCTRNGIYSEGS